jgi:hypothetical protein
MARVGIEHYFAEADYGPTGNRFTGEIAWVLITPEQRLSLAMARQ